jgi:2'-5' RNA ligase
MDETEKEATRRVFFALWPDDAGRAALSAWQPLLLKTRGGRAMRPETLHCTLAFLGAVAESRLSVLQQAAQTVRARRFMLELASVRYWEHNHIVYAAPQTSPPSLLELVGELQSALRAQGFRFDERAYVPHVTLLRDAGWNEAPLPAMAMVRWPVQDFVLVQSLSGAGGVRYEVLARFGAAALE